MGLLKLKAKVLLVSEEQMEAEDKYDLGNIAKSKEWVWRNIAVSVEHVYRIIEYNKNKTIVQMNDEEKILVSEPFDEVFTKWEELQKSLEKEIKKDIEDIDENEIDDEIDDENEE